MITRFKRCVGFDSQNKIHIIISDTTSLKIIDVIYILLINIASPEQEYQQLVLADIF
mgnify:CR=1 FL=1